MAIRKLLVANRGEIAVRIIRAARELCIATVQVHSEADAESLAVELADEAVEIGPGPAGRSYLDIEAVLRAASASGADAVHPGYGFLAENADFADAVRAEGLAFVGPSGDVIREMGDKASARQIARESGVPTVPGSVGRIGDARAAACIADKIGFPVMIKAAAGGGGRGIRIADNDHEFPVIAAEAAAEAKAAFGDGGLYLEKAIGEARHIEVQILGDGENFVHCFERECSLQRRRQKLWEEAPSPALNEDIRQELCRSAVALAASVGYRGAGTVEFLYDERKRDFYFIEMNTRIQVEHPVTECITGIDLVAETIRIGGGEPLSIGQEQIDARGHAIEVRINAEDPANRFLPAPGIVDDLRLPGGPGVRFDHMLFQGCEIPPFYDSLLGKLIVSADTRAKAIDRLKRALSELRIGGLKTTAPLFLALADAEPVRSGRVHTGWLESWLDANAETLLKQSGDGS